MQINVVHGENRYAINVSATQKIWQVKERLSKLLNLEFLYCKGDGLNENNNTLNDGKYALYYNCYSLNDNCTMSEVGLVPGSTVKCRQIRVSPHALKIQIPALSKEIILNDEVCLKVTTIGELRSILQNKLGIPISTFKLRQVHQDREMYDNHSLSYYGVRHCEMLILFIWDDVKELILNALDEDISKTFLRIPSFHENPIMNRYLLKVVLFIAAHFDLAKLATQVLEYGIQCDDSVGEYPSRQWCSQQSHLDVLKTSVHQAATNGSYRTLNIFLRHNPCMMIVKDGFGRSPSIYAMRNKHIECWKFLMIAQFKYRNKYGITLNIYSKIRKWSHKAKERVLYFKMENRNHVLLLSQSNRFGQVSLGNPIVISGYHTDLKEKDNSNVHKVSAWSSNMQKSQRNEQKIIKSTTLSLDNQDVLKKPLSEYSYSSESSTDISLKYLSSPKEGYSQRTYKYESSVKATNIPPLSEALDTNIPNKKPSVSNSNNSIFSTRRHSRTKPEIEAKQLIHKLTGKSSQEIAAECFQIGQTFDRMSWQSQMKIALKCSENFVERSIER